MALSVPAASSQKLMQCLIRLETAERAEAKMDLVLMTQQLMPEGKPRYLDVVKYPQIRELIQTEGRKKMLAVLVLMVKDFCSSVNVVRNMNEDQMIEAAAMLLDECDNFRLQDYLMMLSMAKRGELVKIYDRLDIQILSEIMDAYWIRRKDAARRLEEEEHRRLNSIGPQQRVLEGMHPQDAKALEDFTKLGAAFDQLRSKIKESGIDGNEI